MVNAVLYTEGGGERGQPRVKNLKIQMRRAFHSFLTKAGIPGGRFRVVRCGSRNQAFSEFKRALEKQEQNKFPILLVDSEDPVLNSTSPWVHLNQRDGWIRPPGATEKHAHLMTQCMESWFLADRGALAT